LGGISALGVQDVSLNNGIEEYEWEFCIENFKEDLRYHSFDKKKCISIGIINTEQHNIDISNVNAQKIAMNGNMDQCQKIKAYSIELDGKTKSWIESGKTSNAPTKAWFESANKVFKPNDTIRMIVNFKNRYIVLLKNNRVICIYKNCLMDTSITFKMYCTLAGVENDFKMSLIHFKTKKYISNSQPLCNRITAAYDKLRDKILLQQQANLSRIDYYDDDEERDIWKDSVKGTLLIYLDTISNYVRIVFFDESGDVILLQYMNEVDGVTKGIDFVDFNGYDYVKFVKMEEEKMQYVQEWLKNKVEKPEYIKSVIYKHGWNDLSLIASAFKNGLLHDLATKMGIEGGDEQIFKDHIQQLLDTDQFNNKIYNADSIDDWSWKLQFVGENNEKTEIFKDLLLS